jgi:hypothetical protein
MSLKMFVVRKIFIAKRNDVTREWRKLHNEVVHHLYSSPNIITQIKSRRMSWAVHVACVRDKGKLYKVLVGSPKERVYSEDQGVDGRMRSEFILGRLAGGVHWIRLAQDRGRWRVVVNAVIDLPVLAPRS